MKTIAAIALLLAAQFAAAAQPYLVGEFGSHDYAYAGAGLQLTPSLAVEGAVLHFDARLHGGQADADGLGAGVLGFLPLRQDWSAYGRLGAYHVNTSQRHAPFDEIQEWVPSFAVGVQYRPVEALRVRVGVEYLGGEASGATLFVGALLGF